ncbi:hypothetical protein IQ265_06575 [Nodosilinea sp. LEGE 06152]|uniref:CopG family ribbon-helix-helix protein n=1 Tax=Nodosilinea sp. LEGE 06152 TaxID=2777966 RepID=UPI00187E64F2|nr:ribbon-helix-helix domain-containing protein [Nodosilinea sp. LEGE 06152]MBE9156494.1 hypothetical protein [Nodosilinea sp. LEGE 06152]
MATYKYQRSKCKPITVSLPENLAEKFDDYASENFPSRSAAFAFALERFLISENAYSVSKAN